MLLTFVVFSRFIGHFICICYLFISRLVKNELFLIFLYISVSLVFHLSKILIIVLRWVQYGEILHSSALHWQSCIGLDASDVSSNADFQYNTDPYNTLPYWTQHGPITCNVDITLSDTTHFFFYYIVINIS